MFVNNFAVIHDAGFLGGHLDLLLFLATSMPNGVFGQLQLINVVPFFCPLLYCVKFKYDKVGGGYFKALSFKFRVEPNEL